MRYGFAGDRQISCEVLKYIISKGFKPEFLLVSDFDKQSHSKDLIEISNLSSEKIFTGNEISSEEFISFALKSGIDYIFGIHFPYIVPKRVLEIPKVGFLNLHPSYLPFNKGWHTPSWAIIEDTPIGATLHFMAEELDKGDIVLQKDIEIKIDDTADKLYQRILKLEFEVFKSAFPQLVTLNPNRKKQVEEGTLHSKISLKKVQKIDLNEKVQIGELFKLIRGLTTNRPDESAFFEIDGKKFGVNINILELK